MKVKSSDCVGVVLFFLFFWNFIDDETDLYDLLVAALQKFLL